MVGSDPAADRPRYERWLKGTLDIGWLPLLPEQVGCGVPIALRDPIADWRTEIGCWFFYDAQTSRSGTLAMRTHLPEYSYSAIPFAHRLDYAQMA